jgi:hypothetical protein
MMKKLIGLLVVLPLLLGLTIHTQFPVTVAWDAGEGAETYEVVVAKADRTGWQVLGTTAALEYTISSLPKGDWVVGVRSLAAGLASDYIWSDEVTDPFVLRSIPGAPGRLRIKL